MWAIVSFDDENACTIVPCSWVKKSKYFWPKNDNILKFIRKLVKPKKGRPAYRCQVLRITGEFLSVSLIKSYQVSISYYSRCINRRGRFLEGYASRPSAKRTEREQLQPKPPLGSQAQAKKISSPQVSPRACTPKVGFSRTLHVNRYLCTKFQLTNFSGTWLELVPVTQSVTICTEGAQTLLDQF